MSLWLWSCDTFSDLFGASVLITVIQNNKKQPFTCIRIICKHEQDPRTLLLTVYVSLNVKDAVFKVRRRLLDRLPSSKRQRAAWHGLWGSPGPKPVVSTGRRQREELRNCGSSSFKVCLNLGVWSLQKFPESWGLHEFSNICLNCWRDIHVFWTKEMFKCVWLRKRG